MNISKKLNNSVILQSSLWFHIYILLRPFCSLVELSILGGWSPQQPLRHWKFSLCKWVWEPRSGVHRGGDRGAADRPVERPGSHLSWCADNRCETSPPFCGSLLGATTGLFVLIFNVFVIFQRSSDFMISVTYFALVNLAMSKVDVHQDQGDQYEDGQGQVRTVMLYFNVLSQRLLKWKTVVTNCCLQFH